jgi:hypothetical protein
MPQRAPLRYRSSDEDSARWQGFPFRQGDIVISTRSKSGTTWVQMICALLIFQSSELPAPLGHLSPWLDWLVEPRDRVVARLEKQSHRRFIKTHTPLDGVPMDRQVTYVVVGRHPLDVAISLYHQGNNLDRQKIRQLTGHRDVAVHGGLRPSLHEWLVGWLAEQAEPRRHLDTLPGLLLHASDAWGRREQDNVVLLHYDEMLRDLSGVMRRLAAHLNIVIGEDRWPALVEAASFEAMKAGAGAAAPDSLGVLKDPQRFFRRGTSGEGREVLSEAEQAAYAARATALADPEVLAWLHGAFG